MSLESYARDARRDIEIAREDNRDRRQGSRQRRDAQAASGGMSQAAKTGRAARDEPVGRQAAAAAADPHGRVGGDRRDADAKPIAESLRSLAGDLRERSQQEPVVRGPRQVLADGIEPGGETRRQQHADVLLVGVSEAGDATGDSRAR